MSARAACRILERALARVRAHPVAPILALAWAGMADDDVPGHLKAMFLVMAEAGPVSLTRWWQEGKTPEDLVALFERALTAAQVEVLEE